MYIRLAAAHANRVQTGALHTCVVHPGFTHWVLSSLEHTQSCNNTWWYEVNINTFLSVNIFFLRSSCSYLWSQSGTAWVQQSHHWPAEESLQLQAQNEPQQAPSSSGLVNLVWSTHSLSSLIYTSCNFTVAAWRWRQHRHMTHRPGWRRCEPCHLLGNEEVLICGRWSEGNLVSWHCYGRTRDHLAALQWAWTSCDRNNDTCNAVTKRGRGGGRVRWRTAMELPKTSKLSDGFVALEIGDVTAKGRSCTFTPTYDVT